MNPPLRHSVPESSPRLWRSLRELENAPDFAKNLSVEFPSGAAFYEDSGLSKRDFLKLMGASLALAGVGLSGCRRPESHIVPFSKAVEFTIPGKFLYYATAMPTRYGAIPLLATTTDGRPIKLEGNPLHPYSNGGTDSFAQAAILDLYDPHRSKQITVAGQPASPAAFDAFLQTIATSEGNGLAILAGQIPSPTRDRLRTALTAKFPNLLWAEFDPLGDAEVVAANAASFGPNVRLVPKFDRADIILAIDSDFLNPIEVGIGYAQGFSTRRNPNQKGAPMNRLYVVESHYTITGGMADHRLRCKASDSGEFTRQLALAILEETNAPDLASVAHAFPVAQAAIAPEWVRECAADLVAHAGRGIVLTGPQTPAPVQVLVHAINHALGNIGATLHPVKTDTLPAASISDLAKAIQQGNVQTLFLLGTNPAYNAPADLGFSTLLARVPDTVHLGLFADETAKACRWHVPAAHFLETWGDVRTFDGTYTSVQPMILPLWNGVSELEILAKLVGEPASDAGGLVQATFQQIAKSGSTPWTSFLRDGFLPDSKFAPENAQFNATTAARLAACASTPKAGALEIVFLQSSSVDDGRYANNSWLLETPDFVTKVAWDNAVLVSPATAKALGIQPPRSPALADIVEISDGQTTIAAATLIAPGHADDSLSLALGYGRQGVSALMDGVGFNAYPLRRTDGLRWLSGVTCQSTGRTYPLAQTQEHHSMEGRDLVREGTLARYENEPTFAQTMGTDGSRPPSASLSTHPPLTASEQWGMTIDLNTCTGCNACVVACQAENNVPVVGKGQIQKNRDMAWLRLDRYFAGAAEDPEMLPQAILCQHCENAPCESVCPVSATVHSDDGLNLMAYNCCIGSRACANNCPWKVRRFNFFDYNQRPLDALYWGPLAKKGMADSLKLAKNPNVTVRMRGVMEKCTFCIQRIEDAKISRLVATGPTPSPGTPVAAFKVACQQACPNDSLVFGDTANPHSAVHRLRQDPRGYTLFPHLNTHPRVTYLARIRNPNPKMPDAATVGLANALG